MSNVLFDVASNSRLCSPPGRSRSRSRSVDDYQSRATVNLFAIEGIADTQCDFKVFRREVVAGIFSRQETVGPASSIEIRYSARRLLMSLAVIAVNWMRGQLL